MTSLDEVRSFWERNPLWIGESSSAPGSTPFYEEHRKIYISDCFAGSFDLRFLPAPRPMGQGMQILDLGCGIGFWVSEFAMRGFNHLHAADLTEQALALTARRLQAFGLTAELSQQNAEKLTFSNSIFDHVNCQGVIHPHAGYSGGRCRNRARTQTWRLRKYLRLLPESDTQIVALLALAWVAAGEIRWRLERAWPGKDIPGTRCG